jgi:aspartyl/asparaginyl-tRNA synthetase
MYAHIVEQGLADLNDFRPYLDIVEEQLVSPHAGYGLGVERILQFLVGSADIRTVSVQHTLSSMMGFAGELERSQAGANSPGF